MRRYLFKTCQSQIRERCHWELKGLLTNSTGHISVSNSSYTIGPSFVVGVSDPSMLDIHLRREGRVKDVMPQVLTLDCIVPVAAVLGLAALMLVG